MSDVLQKVVLAEPDAVQVSIGQVSVCFARSSSFRRGRRQACRVTF